jgi:hypothetical protein
MTTDPQLADLFAQGTAPEHDPAFAQRVASGIGRERLARWIGALALRAAAVLALADAVFVSAGVIRPLLALLFEGSAQFMGVPEPVVLGVLAAGLALSVRGRILSR